MTESTDLAMREDQALIDTAQAAVGAQKLEAGEIRYVYCPPGGSTEVVDLEKALPQPRRAVGTTRAHRVESFVDIVNRDTGAPARTLWADVDQRTVTAIFNDHLPSVESAPGWRDHRCVLTLRASEAWEAWTRVNGHWFGQQEFAGFIEEHLTDIISPDGADMLEMVMSVQAKKNAAFSSAIRLDSGQTQLEYVENIETTTRRGQVEIPSEIALFVPVFEGQVPSTVRVLLRHRINDGVLALGVVIANTRRFVEEHFSVVIGEIQEKVGQRVWFGNPGRFGTTE